MRIAPTLALSLSKLLPRWDLCSGIYVPQRLVSREHVVPKSILLHAKLPKSAIWDIENLYCVDLVINRMRSNYKFIQLPDTDASSSVFMDTTQYRQETKGRQHTIRSINTSTQHMVFDKKKKTFAPPPTSRGAIARTVYRMLNKYPSLYPFLDDIIAEKLMNQWLDLPKYHAELQHDEFLRIHGIAS
jgi:endonuclease I